MMKTLQLKTLPLLLVELPDSAIDIKVFHDIGRPYISYFVGVETFRHYTDEDVELIGKLSELPEEWFADQIGRNFRNYKPQQKLNQQPQYDMFWVRCPDGTDKHFDTKDQCYLWALKMEFLRFLEKQEQVYLNGNPCGDEAQSFTFDPGRTYIFTIKTESNG